ncbi:MAG: hypothetical protein QNI84_01875 [Henriciella sp.]|nr:hypothetical protein [Henriciella sp.]
MRKVGILITASMALAGAAAAGTMDAFIANGVIVEQGGEAHETSFEDGRYTSSDNTSGTYAFEEGTLCLTSDGSDQARCFALPEGKASGDSFAVALPDGSKINVTIK